MEMTTPIPHSTNHEKELIEEIAEIKKVKGILSKQPEVRGGMTDNPNIEDVKKWHEWYKTYEKYRKHPLNLEVKETELKGFQQGISQANKEELEWLNKEIKKSSLRQINENESSQEAHFLREDLRKRIKLLEERK